MNEAAVSTCRILHVASGDLWAGAETQVFEILTALRSCQGIEVAAVILNSGELAERLSAAGVSVEILDENQLSFLEIQRRLIRIVQDWPANVVHSHRRKEHLLAGIAALGSAANTVATVHGRSEANNDLSLREFFLSWVEKLTLRRLISTVVSVSDDLADHLPVAQRNIEVIPNGIDVENIRHRATIGTIETSQGFGYNVAFVGRLVTVKRVDRAIRACERFSSDHGNDTTLHIIGDGPLLLNLKQLAKDLESEKFQTVFHGFLANPLTVLKSMNVLLFTSDHEGLPMAALEALALDVPVVSPAIGGLTKLLNRSPLGYLARGSTPDMLSAALCDALAGEDSIDVAHTGTAVPTENRIESTAASYRKLYRSLAGL